MKFYSHTHSLGKAAAEARRAIEKKTQADKTAEREIKYKAKKKLVLVFNMYICLGCSAFLIFGLFFLCPLYRLLLVDYAPWSPPPTYYAFSQVLKIMARPQALVLLCFLPLVVGRQHPSCIFFYMLVR